MRTNLRFITPALIALPLLAACGGSSSDTQGSAAAAGGDTASPTSSTTGGLGGNGGASSSSSSSSSKASSTASASASSNASVNASASASSGTGGKGDGGGGAGQGGSGGAPPGKCGDGKVDAGEDCDKGTDNSDTGACTTACKNASCGDGFVEMGVEQCDEGASNSDTGTCTKACILPTCGDGAVNPGEDCDLGVANSDTGTACTTKCKVPDCGDGFVEATVEQCDLGPLNTDTGTCTKACKTATCGDGLVETGIEQCDLGAANGDTAACTKACKSATCGDGLVEAGVEQCDLGAANTNTGACTKACKNAVCGDGFKGPGEACDDGNKIDGDGCNTNCIVSGTPLWTQSFDGATHGDDGWYGAAVDAAGNLIVVGGTTSATGADVVVRKMDPAGNTIWTQMYDGAAHKDDQAYGVAVDPSGNFIVVGVETLADDTTDMWLRKYDTNGNTVWTQNYNGGGTNPTDNDVGYAVTTNKAGDIFIGGTVQTDATQANQAIVAKIANINGTLVWGAIVDGVVGQNDGVFGVTVDAAGAVIATGFTSVASGFDTWTRKYQDNGVTGTELWTRTYNSATSGTDVGTSVATDAANNIYVAGYEASAQGSNVWVRKYDKDANVGLTLNFNGAANGDDGATGIVVGADGSIVVAGYEALANVTDDVWVRKYSSTGAVLWTQGYNGTADKNDFANAIAMGPGGVIYVVGDETTSTQVGNGWIRKYAP